MSGSPPRRMTACTARVVGLMALGGGLVLGATYLPAPVNLSQRTGPAAVTAIPAESAKQTLSICPGPEALGVAGLPDSTSQTVSVVAASAPRAALPAGFSTGTGAGSITITGLPSGGKWAAPASARGQVIGGQLSAARSALVTGTGTMAPGTVATQWSWTRAGNARGLVTAPCRPAAVSSWFVAGGPAPGRLEHLVLTNAGSNPVTVDLQVLGVKGLVSSPDAQGLVVAGHSRTVILVDAIAGSEPSPVVHVIAHGGKIGAVLSDTWLDGVVPRGGDDVASQAAPAREQVVAGVSISGRATLRLAVPGEADAVVESRVLTPSGPRPLPAGAVTRVPGGSTRDVDLGSLPPGAYGIQVRADVPVVAAVMVDRRQAGGGPSDLAWAAASDPISTLAGMALPASEAKQLIHRLDLVATGNPANVLVTTVAASGRVSTKEVAIAADSVSLVPLSGAVSVWVTPVTGVVRAAVVTSFSDAAGVLLSVTPLADLTLTTIPYLLHEESG